MSISESNARNTASQQKLAILGEATKAQLPVMACVDSFDEAATLGGAIGGSLKALFGGSVQSTGTQIFAFAAGDAIHVYVQPYDGMYAMPGEHHQWIPGAWNSPTMHKHDTWGAGWEAGGDAELVKYILNNPGLKTALEDTTWEWTHGMGEFKYPWSLQTRPVTNGYTHVTMAATGEQNVMTHQTGVVEFGRLVAQLTPMLPQNPAVAETTFLHPTAYDSLYAQIATRTVDLRNGVPETTAADYGQTIHGWLAPQAAKKLYVGNLPPKQDGNIRNFVMPPFARAWPIVAAVDLTMMGSAKEALALTPTHLFVREEGGPAFFQYSDLSYVDPVVDDDTVWVQVSCLGEIGLPCGKFAQPLHAALTAIAIANTTAIANANAPV